MACCSRRAIIICDRTCLTCVIRAIPPVIASAWWAMRPFPSPRNLNMHIDRGQTLLAIARGAIPKQLGAASPPFDETEWLDEPGATFVTLTCAGALRGCIGSLVAERALRADV